MQKVLREIVDAVGYSTAIELVRRWGGRAVYIPTTVEPQSPLALCLGLEPARKLSATFGGRRMELPSERSALREQRDLAIEAGAKQGKTHEALAAEFGLLRQTVGLILKRLRERQLVAATDADATTGQSRRVATETTA